MGMPGTGDVGTFGPILMTASNGSGTDYTGQFTVTVADASPNAWQLETVDSHGSTGAYSSLVIDENDAAHIAYYDSLSKDLKYATNASGLWVTETAESAQDDGSFCSLVLDSNGWAHISYYSLSACTLHAIKYATNSGGLWTTEIVDAEYGTGG